MFVISEQNPNDTCGGDCACGHHPTDQKGPFIVFQSKMAPRGGRQPQTVVCAPCAKSAVIQIEHGGEVARVGAGHADDKQFDGGAPDMPADLAVLKNRYESEAARSGDLLSMPSFDDWLSEHSDVKRSRNLVANGKTGIDPNATSLLQARADTSPVGIRGDRTPVGRIDDPAEQVGNPDNWGTPEELAPVKSPGGAIGLRPVNE